MFWIRILKFEDVYPRHGDFYVPARFSRLRPDVVKVGLYLSDVNQSGKKQKELSHERTLILLNRDIFHPALRHAVFLSACLSRVRRRIQGEALSTVFQTL